MKQVINNFIKFLFVKFWDTFYRVKTKNNREIPKEPYSLSSSHINSFRKIHNKRKVYKPDDYHNLLSPYKEGYENLTYADYVREHDIGDRKILLLRHDIDHDYQTAIKIAEWESRHGFRATYCLLHTAWYYGHLEGERLIHTQNLVDFARRLNDLGHEINLHNNLVVTALNVDINPAKLLSQELDFFHSIGINITGTSTHGDSLCRKLNFRNWELFKECCDDRFGGPRTISYNTSGKSREIRLGGISMFDFGLEYEGYDIVRNIYHTDSGGNLRTRRDARGRRPFGRKDPKRGEVVGILTHPIWWDFG